MLLCCSAALKLQEAWTRCAELRLRNAPTRSIADPYSYPPYLRAATDWILQTLSPFSVPSQRRAAPSTESASRRGPGWAHFRSPVGLNQRLQFASSPRFLFSQTAAEPIGDGDDIESSGPDEPSSSYVRARSVPTRHLSEETHSGSHQIEVIEDFREEECPPNVSALQFSATSRIGNVTTAVSVNPQDKIDAESEFPPTPNRKRRRLTVSSGETQGKDGRSRTYSISPTSSEPPSPSTPPCHGSSPPDSPGSAVTHIPYPSISRVKSSRLAPKSAQTPVRSHHRFLFSESAHFVRPTEATPTSPEGKTPSSAPQRRRTNFILPRSPSPPGAGQDAESPPPPPFSPSSRTLHRRGRPRATAPSYLPGGMAAEVRGWILEMGAKRGQYQHPVHTNSHSNPSKDSQKYFATIQIETARSSKLNSGLMTSICGHPVESESPELLSGLSIRRVILLGPSSTLPRRLAQDDTPARPASSSPRLLRPPHHVPRLEWGNIIGIRHGLVWEIELDDEEETESCLIDNGKTHDLDVLVSDNPADAGCLTVAENSARFAPGATKKNKWLVAAEWDLLP
jgi:hypothetical protein